MDEYAEWTEEENAESDALAADLQEAFGSPGYHIGVSMGPGIEIQLSDLSDQTADGITYFDVGPEIFVL